VGWRGNSRWPWRCCPRSWVARPQSRWTWVGPPGWSAPPNAPPWPSAMAAVSFRAVPGRWLGVRAITCGIGWMVARPICGIWPWCAGPIIGRSMRGAGGWPAGRMGGSPPPRLIEGPVGDRLTRLATDDSPPPPDPAGVSAVHGCHRAGGMHGLTSQPCTETTVPGGAWGPISRDPSPSPWPEPGFATEPGPGPELGPTPEPDSRPSPGSRPSPDPRPRAPTLIPPGAIRLP
jgi:hypothetical protein